MAESKQWIVTVSGDRPFADVARELADAGFDIATALDEIGVFTGRSDDAVADRVRGVKGVSDVSADAPVDIGPPDSDQTW